MFKTLACVGIFVGATVSMVACSSNNGTTPPKDFSTGITGDMTGGGGDDMSVTKMYTATTPHEVDVDTIGGNFGQGTAISMTALTVLAPPSGFSATYMGTSKAGCRYEVWAQDATCTTPPCGILLETQVIANPNGTGMFCPFASDTTTALKDTWRGDVVNVTGVVDLFANTGAGEGGGTMGTVVQHEIELDTLVTTTVKGELPDPIQVTDDATTSKFIPYSGSGWAMYEATYIKLVPATGKFTTTLNTSPTFTATCTGVTGKTNGSFTTAPGGAYFADTYAGFYKMDGGVTNCIPANGSMFGSISAIVSTGFGGSLLPAQQSDFQP